MKDGAIVANSGHFNVELDLKALADIAVSRREVRDFVEEFDAQGWQARGGARPRAGS